MNTLTASSPRNTRPPPKSSTRDALRFLVRGLPGIALYNALVNTGEQIMVPHANSEA